MPTSVTFPAAVLDQTETPDLASRRFTGYRSTRYISPAFRGLMYAIILESLIVACACASYFGWHRLLHR
jgi:hypothetical protein